MSYFTLRIIVILMETIKDLDNQHGSDGLTQKQRETTPLVRKRHVRVARMLRRSSAAVATSREGPPRSVREGPHRRWDLGQVMRLGRKC